VTAAPAAASAQPAGGPAGRDGPALDGVRVLDLSEGIPGAFAARVLAEAGARVIKVERPGGDPTRNALPAGFATWNRSKHSLVLDLATASGRSILTDLLGRADVLVHDLTRTAAARCGLDDESLAESFPHLVIGAVTSWPAGHPREDQDDPEIIVHAVAGLMDEQQGNRAGPIFVRLPYATWCAAFLLTAGLLARLVQRERTGIAGVVRTSLLQGGLVPTALFWQRYERLPAALEEPHTLPKIWPGASLGIFECRDGVWIQLAGSLGGWVESPPVLEMLAVADEVELSDAGVTPGNRARWQQVFRERDSAWWFRAFSEADVPCMIVRDLGDCFTDEQALLNDYCVQIDDPGIGPSLQVGPPVTLTPPGRDVGPAPAVGTTSADQAKSLLGPVRTGSQRHRREPGATLAGLPLAGIRVLDIGSMIAGPFAAGFMADLGADVIKVEPISGDRGRGLTQFAAANRRKRSLAIDLKHPAAAGPVADLVRSADVVVHNIRPASARRVGLDLGGLRALNERVVVSHVTAYGSRGPMGGFPGYDPTAQAMTGWERANVGADRPPMWLRNSVLDVGAGLAGAVGALIGLYRRERTGTAGSAETSLLAVGMTIASETAVKLPTMTPFPVPEVDFEQTGTGPFHRIYQVSDGWIAVAARTPQQQDSLTALAGGAGSDLAATLSGRAAAELVALLHRSGVSAAKVELDQMDAFFDDPDNRELGLARRIHAADYGRLEVPGGFLTMSGDRQSGPVAETVPALGSDTTGILRDLGYSDSAIEDLIARGVASPSLDCRDSSQRPPVPAADREARKG
jgi:crotonobetainyl-CoA:carnitine CoA-transferase CaiB-like acyl-CoA transferase